MPYQPVREDIHSATDKLLKKHGENTAAIARELKAQFPDHATIQVNAYYYIEKARERAVGEKPKRQKPGPKGLGLTNVTIGVTKEQLDHLKKLAGGNVSEAVRHLVEKDMEPKK